jgi:enamine deaminase RidA (YjgF/YER057c/UK114 family)
MQPPLRERLIAMHIDLPKVSGPFGAYVPAKLVGNLVYVSGQLPMKNGKLLAIGQVPLRCAVDVAKAAARQCAINALAAAATLGEPLLDRMTGVVRVGAFISSDGNFTQQPAVANGASELFLELFGDEGKHVRAAVGVNTLPLDASVEVEVIFALSE